MKSLINFIGRWKNRVAYFTTWLTPISSMMMIGYILQEKLALINIEVPFLAILLLGFFGIIFGSLFVKRIGLYSADQEHTLNNNKALIELIRRKDL